MSYCSTKGSLRENQPRCIITLITAYLTWLVKRKTWGTVSIWRTDHFLQDGKLEDSTETRGKKEVGTEEGKAGTGIVWDFLAGLLTSLPPSFTVSLGTFLGPANLILSGTGLLLTPKASETLRRASWPPCGCFGSAAANRGTRGVFQLLASDRERWVLCPPTSPPLHGESQSGRWAMACACCPRCGGPCVSPLSPPASC